MLAVGGLLYGSSRSIAPRAPVSAPVMSLVEAPISPPPAPPVEHAARARPPRFPRRAGSVAIADYVQDAAARYGVPASLVAAVISVESASNSRAVSQRGALGLMQLMPGTAALLGVRDAFDPRENVDAGARHLRDLLDRFSNDVSLALAAYNAGPQAVVKHGGMPPYPETRAFVARVLARVGHVLLPLTAPAHPSSPARAGFVRHATARVRGGDAVPDVLYAALQEDTVVDALPTPSRSSEIPVAVELTAPMTLGEAP